MKPFFHDLKESMFGNIKAERLEEEEAKQAQHKTVTDEQSQIHHEVKESAKETKVIQFSKERAS